MVESSQDLLSIGALERLSGLPAATLRNWERRYGFPKPQRLSSGHRRYSFQAVSRLRLIKQALSFGLRPSSVVPAPIDALRGLVLRAASAPLNRGGTISGDAGNSVPYESLLNEAQEAVERYDGAHLDALLVQTLRRLGAERFCLQIAAPLMARIGSRWGNDTLAVGQEHFATGVLSALLSSEIRAMANDEVRGPTVVCACLPNEEHTLGLLMAAVLIQTADGKAIVLGANTPTQELASAAEASQAQGVLLASSPAGSPSRAVNALQAARVTLASHVQIAWGGYPQDLGVEGCLHLDGLHSIGSWVRMLERDMGAKDPPQLGYETEHESRR